MKKLLNADTGKVFKKNLSIILTIVVFLTCSFMAFYVVRGNKALEQQILQIEQQNLSDTITGVEYTFNQISQICSFYANIQLTELKEPFNEANYYSFLTMKKQIDISKSFYSAISNIYIKNSINSYYTGGFKLSDKIETIEKECLGKVGNVQICKTNVSDTDSYVFFEFLIDEDIPGFNNVYIEIDSYQMSKILLNDKDKERKEYLVDNQGNIIFSVKNSEIGRNISELYNIKFDNTNNSVRKFKNDGKDYLLSLRKINNFDLYTVNISNKNMYNNYFIQTYSMNITLSILFLMIACVAGSLILWVTYKPIRNIAKELNKYGPPLYIYNNDEEKYITEATKNLYFENKKLSNSIYEKANEIRKIQIKMLQAQICPHFICNTLDAINWMVYRYINKRNNPLSKTIQNMSLILQNNLDLTTMFTSVRDEIEITNRYIEILRVRYENSFDIEWDIDEEVLENIIMKLCIQPLIENAASHAFTGIKHNGKIDIAVKDLGTDIMISVKDNGIGMSAEHLQEVINHANDFNNSRKYIGMRNINYRLILLYGEQYKLSIESSPMKGTSCSFRIPKSLKSN